MAQPRPWADLPPELVSCIAGRLKALRCYLAARGVCKAWRSALESASPYVVRVCRIRVRGHAVAVSLPLQRSFRLATINSYSRCTSSCHGWLAVVPYLGSDVVLMNPLMVLAYVRIRNATCSFEVIPVDMPPVDVVYHAGEGIGAKFYCLFGSDEVHVLRVPRDLQATPVLEPLLDGVPSGPTDIFAPPFSILLEHTRAKHLVFCQGNLYQIWRNTGGAMDVEFPGGGSLHMSKNEVFILRHASARRPCWEAVGDLGGHSVFVGLNNAVSVHAVGIAGLKGNRVYWVSDFEKAMVFDMETKRSTRLHRGLLRW